MIRFILVIMGLSFIVCYGFRYDSKENWIFVLRFMFAYITRVVLGSSMSLNFYNILFA